MTLRRHVLAGIRRTILAAGVLALIILILSTQDSAHNIQQSAFSDVSTINLTGLCPTTNTSLGKNNTFYLLIVSSLIFVLFFTKFVHKCSTIFDINNPEINIGLDIIGN